MEVKVTAPFFEFLTRFSILKSDWSMKSRTFAYLLRNQYAFALDQWPKSMRFATTLLSERQLAQT